MTLLLCTAAGELLGSLPPFVVATPWWQETADVVAAAAAVHGIDVTVLRRVAAPADGRPPGGPVTYLAEVAVRPRTTLAAWPGSDPLAEQPHRLPWARPGGPAADVAWADAQLDRLGRPRTGKAVQIRTWNLSSIWRLPTGSGTAWLKVVPPFFAHEGQMLTRLAADVVPPLLAYDGGRVLLDHIPGDDRYVAALPELVLMVDLLVALQSEWRTGRPELDDLHLPDWRHPAVAHRFEDTYQRTAAELDAATRAGVEALLGSLDQRYADLASCGLPDTLVHGDFHPGNVRGSDGRLVLLDWGDCGVGHPLLDQAAFLSRIADDARAPVAAHWAQAWRAQVAGCDPQRAARLVEPLAALRQALVYRTFLDNIEPDEHVYHRDDPADWLRRAATAARHRP